VNIATPPPVTPAGGSLPVRGPLNLTSPGLFPFTASEESPSPRLVGAKSSDVPLPKPRPAAYRRAGAHFPPLRERPTTLETDDVRVHTTARRLMTMMLVAAAAVLALQPAIMAALVVTRALGPGADRYAAGALPNDLWSDAGVARFLLTLVLAYRVWRTDEVIHEDGNEPA
jgi:hypothetical protein